MLDKLGNFCIIFGLVGILIICFLDLYIKLYKPHWAFSEIDTRIIKVEETNDGECIYFFKNTSLAEKNKCGLYKIGDKLEFRKVED